MSHNSTDNVIPPQEAGAQSDTYAFKKLDDDTTAKLFFKVVCDRLKNVNSWQKYSGDLTADFRLCDEKGNEVDRSVQKSDRFKIDVPGPGTIAGNGYDWVKVEAIEESALSEGEMIMLRVRPASNPTDEKNDTAHFFTEDSTSSFIVKRIKDTVSAEVHGRNEKLNVGTGNILDKTRNALAGAAAIAGASEFQWKSLTKGLIDYTEEL